MHTSIVFIVKEHLLDDRNEDPCSPAERDPPEADKFALRSIKLAGNLQI